MATVAPACKPKVCPKALLASSKSGSNRWNAELDSIYFVTLSLPCDLLDGSVFQHGITSDQARMALFAFAVLVVETDEAHFELARKCGPFLGVQGAADRLLGRLFPGHDALVFADSAALAPIELGVPGLMQAYQGVNIFFMERGLDFVGAEGAVGADEVARVETMEQLAENGRVVREGAAIN